MQSSHLSMPSPYIVSLIADSAMQDNAPAGPPMKQVEEQVPPKQSDGPALQKDDARVAKKNERTLSDRISAMEAKNKALKLAELRKRMKEISSKSVSQEGKGPPHSTSPKGQREGTSRGGPATDNYIAGVAGMIRAQFVTPNEIENKKLKTSVSLRISMDGSVQITRVQSSGNSLLDRSAVKAVKMASPLPRPPREMDEIEFTFCPTKGAKCEW